MSLGVAVAGALAIGFGIYFALDSITIADGAVHLLDGANDWSTLAVGGFTLVLLSCAGAIVSLVRARPRTAAAIALAAAVVLPVVGAIWGAKVGVQSLVEHAERDASSTGVEAVRALGQLGGTSLEPLIKFLLILLGS